MLKKLLFVVVSMIFLLLISGYVYLYILPKGPEVTETQPLNQGKDSFVIHAFKESKRKSIRVWTYKPHTWENEDKIVFVMHGGGRNADDYLEAWKDIAETNNLLILAPEFENKFSQYTTNDYQEGNLFTFFGSRNSKEEWGFTVIENIFDHIKMTNQLSNKTYDIFGHSAGGQFVHRMVMLLPDARIGTAIAANSGFYTLPDDALEFPYGMKNTELEFEATLMKAYEKELIILLGEMDNDPNLGTFRTTDLAMEQGFHRLERGSNFFSDNSLMKERNGWVFNWQIDTIKNVGHDYQKMALSAAEWLKK